MVNYRAKRGTRRSLGCTTRPNIPRVNETSDRVTVEVGLPSVSLPFLFFFSAPSLRAHSFFLFCLFFLITLVAERCIAYSFVFTFNFTTSPHLTRAHILSHAISRNTNRARQSVSASHRDSGDVYEERYNRDCVDREGSVQVYAPEDYSAEGDRE